MADREDHPLLTALPPATDYISYLTILEYNLSAEQLPILHDILQDRTLTANIGWDLVHLLLPLLPASQQCLQDVARLGNPREVVLKVTELLESLGRTEPRGDDEEDGEDADAEISHATDDGRETSSILECHDTLTKPTSSHAQFNVLLEMLSILHPRIQTKYPSRFLSTSLQAILPAYLHVASEPSAADAVLSFVKCLSGVSRPKLPPRKSSVAVYTAEKAPIAPDPEGQDDLLAPNELALQNRLLQSFLTRVMENFMTSLPSLREIPGLAWSCRLHEKQHPARLIPGRESYNEMFANEEELHERDTVVGQAVALARDLKILSQELLSVVSGPESEYRQMADELPSSAADVDLSRTGSLYLLSAQAAASDLFDVPPMLAPIRVFPDFSVTVEKFIGHESTDFIGSEKDTIIDAVLFLGFHALNASAVDASPDDDTFKSLLQRLSLLSAHTPSAALRYNAHVLASTILHSHPSDHVRLSFIQDTLEHCPYENLKASSIAWLKEEILTATKNTNPTPPAPTPLFSSPSTLSALSPFLFLNPHPLITSPPDFSPFQAHLPFYLAVLNFYYLLLASDSLFASLHVSSLTQNIHLRETFLSPLFQVVAQLGKEIGDGGERGVQREGDGDHAGGRDDDLDRLGPGSGPGEISELDVMREVLDRVDEAMRRRGL